MLAVELVPLAAVGVTVTLVDAALLSWWLFRIDDDWVRVAAEAYADRLVKAYLGLKSEKASAAA